jgi:hypothetical protein
LIDGITAYVLGHLLLLFFEVCYLIAPWNKLMVIPPTGCHHHASMIAEFGHRLAPG